MRVIIKEWMSQCERSIGIKENKEDRKTHRMKYVEMNRILAKVVDTDIE